ncbi:group 1 truncated hemoglobin [Streptomyces sp. A7024]|uniref:Group 1 truncated hemoglobin n=1 Tax=Streptomyces coryli TaxID=1128680 RepID=A0A6G4TW36_9ACTN|nr:group 1 truncated hemoglobin [Streptomyces coryli]NGN63257.1 group 1 truncated hemoglobin [Streptomyces coryli]
MSSPSLYETIGGAPAVGAAVDDFYVRVLADPELAGYFTGVPIDKLKAHQRDFIGAALGGPEAYEGLGMEAAHAKLGITPEHFDRVVGHLAGTLESLGVDAPTIKEIAGALAPLKADIAQGA